MTTDYATVVKVDHAVVSMFKLFFQIQFIPMKKRFMFRTRLVELRFKISSSICSLSAVFFIIFFKEINHPDGVALLKRAAALPKRSVLLGVWDPHGPDTPGF